LRALNASESGWIGGIYFAGNATAVPFLASATDRMDGRWLYVGRGPQRLIDYGIATGNLRGRTVQRTSG